MRTFLPPVVLVFLGATSSIVRSQEQVDYLRQIKPVLQERCYACHGVLKHEAGLRLDTAALARQGGDSGAIINSTTVPDSLLLQRVTAKDQSERMPPEGEPLTATQIKLIEDWIAQGASGPADEQPERDPRDHWAFKPPVRPPVPRVTAAEWNRNPIDAFVAAEQERQGVQPQSPSDPKIWLRRVYLDLIGLPPTREELNAFVAHPSPQAVEAVVNRLLESPQYGERWGRHWMDIWRYSDWWGLGAEVRNSQKHIWHWRDWIIESLNADKGYDQMLREMVAADELYPNDLDRLRASGFLARQYFKFNRTSWLDETIEHTSKAMLGLTFNCSKCHDHKYDPITQADYYRFRAIFEPYQIRTDLLPGAIDFERDGVPRAFDCNLDALTYLHVRGDDRNPDKTRALDPAVPEFLVQSAWKIEPVSLPVEAHTPGLRPFVIAGYQQAAEREINEARNARETARQSLTGSMPAEYGKLEVAVAERRLSAAEGELTALQARVAAERALGQEPPSGDSAALAQEAAQLERLGAQAKAEEHVARAELDLARSKADKKVEMEKKLTAAKGALESATAAVEKPASEFTRLAGALKTPESNLEKEESRRKPFPRTSTGRRSALAKWLTEPRNPLPARVAVNHVWLRHFGRPLVPTVFDFGRKGTPPTHPELLDWLAVEFMEHGWNFKHLHRLIVTSNTYRLASTSAGASAETLAKDPENKLYWRAHPIRMEAQLVRDSLLHLAGELDLTLGGPSIPVSDEKSRRRSLYFVHSHNEHQKFLSMFDDAGVLECYRRADSIVPQQALALENSPLATAMGEKIARRILADSPHLSDRDFIRVAFLTVLCVEPSESEKAVAAEGLTRLTAAARDKNRANPTESARIGLVHALLNHNDFVTVR